MQSGGTQHGGGHRMAETQRWRKNTETQAFLVALDIAGFSRHMDEPDQLLEHRESFLRAIEDTGLFAQAKPAGSVVTHFLGDELRLAFRGAVGAQAVCTFVDEALAHLARSNDPVIPERHTSVKGVVYAGVVIWREWRKCTYLDGPLPFKAQRWMAMLQPGEIAVDDACRSTLESEGVPTARLAIREFMGETGYLLHEGTDHDR
jgi:hypothetical protein